MRAPPLVLLCLAGVASFQPAHFRKHGNTRLASTADIDPPSVPAFVIRGLAEHKVTLGAPLCPCRHYEDKAAEVKKGYWNCPCVPMREEKQCHCMLFLTDDNEFAGDSKELAVDDVPRLTESW
ncbi:ferredoxin:thioredoxin reductase [Aureococcus anophagefferens]|nr:ferredoxin:thioredoxin reductase [Aureococcus anophagefferens]